MTSTHSSTGERQRDPVCGMSVRVDVAHAEGLVADHDGHPYVFCRAACREAFLTEPARYLAGHAHDPSGASASAVSAPEIDEGMRRWYESCACCLSDAYPEVKAALDAERETGAPAPAGICEVAEAAEAAEAPEAAPARS